MYETESNIKISWQLVSQFVSWDFCRYTCEQNEAERTESDVLTFLRNMIVERTEKAATDITKHEIVAKFIMEAKTIRNISRISCITALADTVKQMCPELKKAITKLIDHLEAFLNVLDWNEDSEKAELLEARMVDAVNEFSKQACSFLPFPDLLQVVKSLKPKYPANPERYKQVLNRLRQELKDYTIKEMETFAGTVLDDENFKKVMYKIQVAADSQSMSIDSAQIPTEHSFPDSLQLSERFQPVNFAPRICPTVADNSLSLDHSQSNYFLKPHLTPQKPNSDSQQSLDPPFVELHSRNPYELAEHIDQLGSLTESEAYLFENPNPTPLFPSVGGFNRTSLEKFISPSKGRFPNHTFRSESFSLRTSDPIVINIQPYKEPDYISGESDCDFLTQRPAKLKCYKKKKIMMSQNGLNEHSDSQDTSDCDKDPEFRFLTPTLFKKNADKKASDCKIIYLSDQESCGSSIVTTFVDSQKYDPNFKTTARIFPKIDSPVKSKSKKPPQKKKGKTKIPQKQTPSRQTTLRDYTAISKPTITPSLNDSRTDFQRNVGKKKKFKLFNTDAAAPLPNVTPIARKRKLSKNIKQALGNKRHCTECSITFRTSSELKKHVFIFHTNDDFSD